MRKLAQDLHPSNDAIQHLGLEADLDKAYGFDSIGRAELILRLERQFGVTLPDELRAEAQTPADLLNALVRSEAKAEPFHPHTRTVIERAGVSPVPDRLQTLNDVLAWHADHHPDRPHILLSNGDAEEEPITYATLAEEARAVAGGMRAWGLLPGETVAIMLPTGRAFFLAFMGTLLAGGIPVPVYPPARATQIEEHLRSRTTILQNCQAALLLTTPQARRLGGLLLAAVPTLRSVFTLDELDRDASVRLPRGAKGSDVGMLQYTSGSTGDPKGVVLTHNNLIANIRGMGQAVAATPDDIYVSWLPLYHDMGLIGAWLSCLYFAVPTIIMSPLNFLARPERWLWTIHRNKGTVSAAPNFAYSLCAAKIADEDIDGLDLSSWRFTANAAEPVSPDTMRRFTERFSPYGFQQSTMHPSYGLAECATGLTFTELGRGPRVDLISRRALARNGHAVPITADEPDALEMVSSGKPMLRHEVRIVDATGHELPDREQGRLQFRGPSATTGYYRDEAKTRALFDGDWLESGDLGYVANGEVFITGRSKDVIIRAGRLIHPAEAEEAIGRIEGITQGAVIMFGVPDQAAGTERLVVVAESKLTGAKNAGRLSDAARERALAVLGEPVDEVVIVPRHAIPKTSSGKLRRFQARENYLAGRPEGVRRPLWWQMARFALAGVRGRAARFGQVTLARVYAVYWWAIAAVCAALLWPTVIAIPRLNWRWALMRRAIHLALFLQGHRLTVTMDEPPPDHDVVFVANHTSYLDSAVLTAALPGSPGFVRLL